MKVILETLCGCTREYDVRDENGRPPEQVRMGIMERVSVLDHTFSLDDKIEMRYRTFKFDHRKRDCLWVFLEAWVK